MSRPEPGAESVMRRGFPDAVQKKILIIYGAIFGVGVLYAFLILHMLVVVYANCDMYSPVYMGS